MPVLLDITDLRFTRLVAKNRAGKDHKGRNLWLCLCDCGNEKIVQIGALRSGNTKSCGCLDRDLLIERNKNSATHGKSRTPIYQVWNAMLQRCENEKDQHYPDYGGRGIKVCEAWHTFENFYADMGDKPGPEYSIERKRVNGDYEPSNCEWATATTQANNRRNSRLYTYKGELGSASQFSRKYNINLSMLEYRLYNGWTIEDAIEKPSKAR